MSTLFVHNNSPRISYPARRLATIFNEHFGTEVTEVEVAELFLKHFDELSLYAHALHENQPGNAGTEK